jgi:hypothetical protein
MNLYMTFRYNEVGVPDSFGYVITQKAFDTFVTGNQPDGTRFSEEDVAFPKHIMHGSLRKALVHYAPGGKKFAAYVPVFPTDAEAEEYSRALRSK